MKLIVPLPFRIAPLAHGRNLRIVHLLARLSRRCDVLCAAADEHIARGVRELLPECQVVTAPTEPDSHDVRAATLRGPWLLRRAAVFFGYDPAFHAWVDRESSRADAALGFDLPSAMYLAQLGEHAGRTLPTICDVIDDPWLTYRSDNTIQQLSGTGLKTAVAVQVFRRRLLRQVTRIVAIAPRDAESLAAAVRRTVSIVPNGVELVTTSPHPHDREPLAIFTGAMSFSPNEEAACYLARVIWPQVLARVPDARLALVGTDPTPRVQALAGSNNVMVTGRVKDMREWLQRARVATAPMLTGTGMKNKVLEACASACPVVATTMGAAGLPVGESNGILIADAPSALAGALVALLKDARRAEQIGLAGAAMARERFNWSHSVDLLWTVIQQATGMTDPNWSTTRQSRPALSAIEPTIGKEELIHAAS